MIHHPSEGMEGREGGTLDADVSISYLRNDMARAAVRLLIEGDGQTRWMCTSIIATYVRK
jgi:hypothetical protein